jgi:hypothetical protein
MLMYVNVFMYVFGGVWPPLPPPTFMSLSFIVRHKSVICYQKMKVIGQLIDAVIKQKCNFRHERTWQY